MRNHLKRPAFETGSINKVLIALKNIISIAPDVVDADVGVS